MMRRSSIGRRGFTIVEIITSLTIIAIIGLAMTKLVLGQARSFQYDNGARRARAAARSAMNILITDLRMTQDNGGVTLATTLGHRIDVRVPTVFGFVCEKNAGNIVAALVPTDSFQTVSGKYGGYAVRDSVAGTYAYVAAGTTDTITATNVNRCHGAGINIFADTTRVAGRAGGVFVMSPAPPGITGVGSPMFVWHTVTYEFKDSQIYSGRKGLYRTVRGRANTDTTSDELIAPFKSSARFSYYKQNPYATRDVPDTIPPASLNDLRGFQIFLPAESSDTMPTRNTPQSANTTTAVFFKNT
ncbi:MAG: prepilin-type N-terminal cleavage/methylation domain-containing protein, partial [bacterium]